MVNRTVIASQWYIHRHLSMDVILGLPKSHGKVGIMVVVNKLMKYAHFMSFSHRYTTTTVTHVSNIGRSIIIFLENYIEPYYNMQDFYKYEIVMR